MGDRGGEFVIAGDAAEREVGRHGRFFGGYLHADHWVAGVIIVENRQFAGGKGVKTALHQRNLLIIERGELAQSTVDGF